MVDRNDRTRVSEGHGRGRWLLASLAAGSWVVLSGMLMAGVFGYREMEAAFETVGLSIPAGVGSLLLHTAMRLVIGMALTALYVILLRGHDRVFAMLAAAGFTWLLAILLPSAVIAGWDLFSWSLVTKLSAWGAVELLIAVVIARRIYAR